MVIVAKRKNEARTKCEAVVDGTRASETKKAKGFRERRGESTARSDQLPAEAINGSKKNHARYRSIL